ncbi:MAG: DUF4003 domain-containing protein [Oscillospiraceae bacterium]|nr:DUF4003 domain-containing protein [Oscillospiraceae bacterium]
MRTSLQSLCNSFIESRDTIKETFFWGSSYIYPVAAAVFVDKRVTADRERLEMCGDILKENTGFFSNFRNYVKLPMISMMAVSSDPEEKLKKALAVYELLKQHFFSSTYLPLASMTISDYIEPVHYEVVARRTRRIYDLMKQEHPFLTSGEDSVFAALLALSNASDEVIVQNTEECFDILKPQFFSSNAVQSLSHVLALCEGDTEMKCNRAMKLFYKLKDQGYKYGTGYELATLGVLAMLPADLDTIADDIVQVAEFLASQRGYGMLGMTKRQRLMHAGLIVTSDYLDQNTSMQAAAVSSTISLIIAQQTAMCAAIAASAAASNSANN